MGYIVRSCLKKKRKKNAEKFGIWSRDSECKIKSHQRESEVSHMPDTVIYRRKTHRCLSCSECNKKQEHQPDVKEKGINMEGEQHVAFQLACSSANGPRADIIERRWAELSVPFWH